jgi:3-oxoacyl-[acyl-carrier protein] reductase
VNRGFEGKVVLVTGAARGIGLATAAAFHEHGAHVALLDMDGVGASAAAAQLGADRAIGLAADVVDLDQVNLAVAQIRSMWHSPDVLVNNAGFPKDGFITKIAVADWRRVVDVILVGAFNCTRATIPAMHERKWGRVINISSRSHLGNPGQTNYSAAKAGLIGFTRALALESGPFGVTANAIAPGFIETEGMLAMENYEVLRERSIAKSPLKRVGQPSDIADAVLFLASDSGQYITGDVMHVTGGRYS